MKKLFFALIGFALFFTASAQYKVAVVDLDSVVRSMPGYSDSVAKVKVLTASLQKQYDDRELDFNKKLKSFNAAKDTIPAKVAEAWADDLKRQKANLDTFASLANVPSKQKN